MSIQVEFTDRDTIRIECNGEIVEVVLPAKPGLAGGPPRNPGNRDPVVLGPVIGRPPVPPRAMAIIANKKNLFYRQNWRDIDPDLKIEELGDISAMGDFQLRDLISHQLQTGGPLRLINVGIKPWSGTTPAELQNLRRIVQDNSFGLDGVRLFQLPGDKP